MTSDEVVLARLDDLIGRANALKSDNAEAPYLGLLAQARSAVAAITGSGSDYYGLLQHKDVATPYRYSGGAAVIAEVLARLRADVAAGYLRRQSDLIAAEVFGDFLDMAGHLLDNGYHHPAASLVGAVLEDGLRRLARREGVDVKPGDGTSVLNNRLASKDVYSNLVRKNRSMCGPPSATMPITASGRSTAPMTFAICTRVSCGSWRNAWADVLLRPAAQQAVVVLGH